MAGRLIVLGRYRPLGESTILRAVRWLAAMVVAAGLWGPGQARALDVPDGARAEAAVDDGDARVELFLVVDQARAAPGSALRAGVLFRLDPEWHVYFRNPGEAAVGTEIELAASAGRFGPIEWPVPRELVDPSGTVTTFGYEREVLLAARLDVAGDAAGEMRLEAVADFLVCKIDCIPGRVELSRAIPIGEALASPADEVAPFVETAPWVARTPEEARVRIDWALERTAIRPRDRVRGSLAVTALPGADRDALGAPSGDGALAFVPDRVPALSVETASVRARPDGAVVDLVLGGGADDPGEDQRLTGIVHLATGDGARPLVVEIDVPVPRARATDEPELVASAVLDGRSDAPERDAPASTARGAPGDTTLALALLFALLGGLLLNLMPCVLPVLAIKAYGLASLAGERTSARAAHAGAYAGGVVGSMLALAGVVIALRDAGTYVGWGFHFQEPRFAALLAALMVVLAMVLFGALPLSVSGTLLAAGVDRSRGLARSAGEGVLAVVLATPCSAPFLGTAIGFAFAGDATTIALVLGAVGVGLAAPQAVFALAPGATRILPRPGPWMVHLERVLGFLLLGTAAWLVWVVGGVAGIDAVGRTLGLLVAIALATWAIGASRGARAAVRRIIVAAAAAVAIGAATLALRFDPAPSGAAASPAVGAARAWSPEAVREETANGRVVLVDFTADWCITCKVNERLVLGSDAVAQVLAADDVTLLVADWTRRDETIRAELARWGKAGVPLYLVVSPHAPQDAEVLPELLTEGIVRGAIERARAARAGGEPR